MAGRQPSPTKQAIRDSIWGQTFGSVFPVLMMSGGLLALLIISILGEDAKLEIGIAIGISKGAMFARLLASPYVDVSWRKRFLVRGMIIAASISLVILLCPILAAAGHARPAAWLLIGSYGAYALALFTTSAAWFPLLLEVLPPRFRGRYFGAMRRGWKTSAFVAVLLSGLLLGRDPTPVRFMIVLVPAVLLQLARVWLFVRLPDPPPARHRSERSVWRDIARPFADAHYRFFALFVVLIAAAEHATLPFVVPFLKATLHFPTSVTLYASTGLTLGSIVSLVGWGRLADRVGNRFVFLAAIGITAVAFALFTLIPDYAVYPVPAFAVAFGGLLLTGVGTAGTGIAYTVRLLHIVPSQHAGPYTNLIQSMIGLVSGVLAVATGFALSRLPAEVAVGGTVLPVLRLYFLFTAGALLVVSLMLRRLPRIAEPRIRDVACRIAVGLPNPFDASRR